MRRVLWGRSTSSNVMKVIWLLEELQLPYERVDVGGPFGRVRQRGGNSGVAEVAADHAATVEI